MAGDRGLYARIEELVTENERLFYENVELRRELDRLRGIDEGGPAT